MPSVYLTDEELKLVRGLIFEGLRALDSDSDKTKIKRDLNLSHASKVELDLAADSLDRVLKKLTRARYGTTFQGGI